MIITDKIMDEETLFSPRVHHGRNIKRLREILGVKQDLLAAEFNITQQAVSNLESKAQLSDEVLEKVAKVLNVPVDAIKNFTDDSTVNVVANTFKETSFLACTHWYQPTFNQIDKLVEMVERLLKAEQEKNVLLEKILAEKQRT